MYLLSRKENYEESDITRLQESINEWAKLFIELFEKYSSSKLQFPKLHLWIRRKVIITESSSKEIPKTPIALKYSKKLYEFYIQNAEIYIQTRMNDPDLEKEMKLGFKKFLECLDAYLDFYDQKLSEHEEIDIKFRIYSGVTLKYGAKMRANNKFHKRPIFSNIAVEMNPDEIFEYTSDNGVCFAQVLLITEIIMNYEEPMHLALMQCGVTLKYGAKMRANNKFHKRPIFSNIAVEMNPDEIFEYTSDNGVCFAQVLLITEIIMNYEEPMHLALMQWYNFKSSVNPYLYKCPLLEKTNIFNLIKIEAINDIIHIIPRFNIDNKFYGERQCFLILIAM
ncbi:hypothetical protein Glove_198g68 [Diversispora epigaea]|uniref:Uncharacterized protein n=1 Tax=Diversispora epigaea TaxID=1348612 RepID=A0A397IKF4_9GLOM|nr:hypothetical protein Glove_198g68 [Diversispora epigaea]